MTIITPEELKRTLKEEEHKRLIKEAFKEYLDDKVKEFGFWSLKTLSATLLGAAIVFLVTHGYLGK